MGNRPNTRTLLIMAGVVILWASAFAGIKAGLVGYTPGQLVLLRFLIASLMLGIYAILTHMRLPAHRDLPLIALTGFLTFSVYQFFLNDGEQTTSAGASSFIIAVVPVITALLATTFLREKINPIGWLGIAISFIGVALIAAGQGTGLQFTPGAVLVLIAAVAEAIGFVLEKPLLSRYTGLEMASYLLWSGTIFLVIFAPGLPQAIHDAPVGATLAVVYLAIFPAAIANVGWSYALSKVSAAQATSLLNIIPLIAVGIAWLWLGELPTPLVIVGGALAIGGAVLLNTRGKQPSPHLTIDLTPIAEVGDK